MRASTSREIYYAIAELERRHTASSDRTGPLTPFEFRCFSQNGEDGVIAEILARIGEGPQFFVEFGIESGEQGNCVYLADVAGWSGLFLEMDVPEYARLEAKYAAAPLVTTLNAAVTPETVAGLFAAASVPKDFDVLSIDIDGQDYWVWEALEDYQPRVVVIEYNSGLPFDQPLVQPRAAGAWDTTDYFGASLGALEHLARRKGYVLVHTDLTALNAFFVRTDLAEGHFPDPARVPRRAVPNYLLQGGRHVPAGYPARYVDIVTGREVVL